MVRVDSITIATRKGQSWRIKHDDKQCHIRISKLGDDIGNRRGMPEPGASVITGEPSVKKAF